MTIVINFDVPGSIVGGILHGNACRASAQILVMTANWPVA